MKKKETDVVLGTMIGMAIGDVGNYSTSVKDEEPQLSVGTLLSLYTANAFLLWEATKVVKKKSLPLKEYVRRAYVEGMQTQKRGKDEGILRSPKFWLSRVKELYTDRKKNRNTIWAGHLVNKEIDDGSCLARVIPVAIYSALHTEEISQKKMLHMAVDFAKISHPNPTGYLAAGILAILLRSVVEQRATDRNKLAFELDRGLGLMAEEYIEEREVAADLRIRLHRASWLAISQETDEAALSELAQGETALDCLSMALFCVFRYQKNLKAALNTVESFTQRSYGDYSMVGTVTGALIGARVGRNLLSKPSLRKVKLLPIIEEIGNDLVCGFPTWENGMTEELSVWLQKYREAIWPAVLIKHE